MRHLQRRTGIPLRCLALISLAILLIAPPLRGQTTDTTSVRAYRLSDDEPSVVVDGRLDDSVWTKASPATDLRQSEPLAGEPATERTEVRVAYDASTLFVAVHAFDRNPDRIIARVLQRDRVMETDPFTGVPIFSGDDAVALLLDTFHDRKSAVVFATNPNGAEFDALLTDEGRGFNIDWRGVWQVRAARTHDGWTAEFAIPFRTLRYPDRAGEQEWGLNVFRVIRHKNEEVLWTSWSRESGGFHRVSRAGTLRGLADLPRSRLNLEIKPYLLAGFTQEQESDRVDTEPSLEPGLDVKYEIAPGLTLDATLNTDFAQVEADDEQVNLTRFDLFFPEKREFFLENAGIFEFGWKSSFEPPPFLLFFSRSIGIDPDSGAVPVLGGLRLSGRSGRQTIGVLDVITDEAYGNPATNFAVARFKRDVGGTNYVGAMVVDRRSADEWNTSGGVDFSYWHRGVVNVQGFVARTSTSGDGGEGTAFRLGADYAGDRFGLSAGHLFVGPGAAADAGFVTRDNIHRTDLLGRFSPRPDLLGLRKVDFYALGQTILDSDGQLQDWQAGPAISPIWESGDAFTLFYINGFNRLDESFDIREDDDPDVRVTIPAGDYDLWQLGLFASSSSRRPVVGTAQVAFQGMFGGTVHSLTGGLSIAPNANLSISASYTRNLVDVPDGSFDADLASLRLSYAFSTRVFVNALIQYNGLDEEVSTNLRFNFIHRPGSDLFVVFNEQRGHDGDLWTLDNRTGVVKVTYLARL